MTTKTILIVLIILFVSGILITLTLPENSIIGIRTYQSSIIIGFIVILINHFRKLKRKEQF